jgi:hypothetical protein
MLSKQTEVEALFGSPAFLLGSWALRPCIAAGLTYSKRTNKFGRSDKSCFSVSKQLSSFQAKFTRECVARQ